MKSKNIFEKNYEINEQTGITASKRYTNQDWQTHTHDFYEIEFIISGSAIHTVNDYSYQIKKGDIYMLSPSDFHSLKIIQPLEYINIMFSEQAVTPSLLCEFIFSNKSTFYRMTDSEYHQILPIFNMISEKLNFNEYWNREYIKNLCECILILCCVKCSLFRVRFNRIKIFIQLYCI